MKFIPDSNKHLLQGQILGIQFPNANNVRSICVATALLNRRVFLNIVNQKPIQYHQQNFMKRVAQVRLKIRP
jgi:hypothetical protein